MKMVYLVRHGESTTNAGGIVLGLEKTPLTQEGVRQAEAVAKRCESLEIDVVIASPALRTKQTAEIIASRIGKRIEYNRDFVEWDRGSYRIGRDTKDPELIERERALIANAVKSEWRDPDPSAENFSDLHVRAKKVLSYLQTREEQNILVVGHGLFTRVLLGEVLLRDSLRGEDFRHLIRNLKIDNTGLTILQFDRPSMPGEWAIITWNDHAHLG